MSSFNPFKGIFLTRNQIDTLSQWKYAVKDNGMLNKVINPVYDYIAQIIPNTVSANMISFAGLIFSIYAWYFSCLHYNIATAVCILIYMTLDALDGKHARNTRTSSPLGELVDHFFDCITNVLLMISFCNIMFPYGLSPALSWLLVVATQMTFLFEHVKAFTHPNKLFVLSRFANPTETLVLLAFVIAFAHNILLELKILMVAVLLSGGLYAFYGIYRELFNYYRRTRDYATLFGISLCFVVQIAKFLTLELSDPISNGIIFSTLCADLILGKMANRPVHQLVPILHLISCLNQSLSVYLALGYFIINLIDISTEAQIPIINPLNNVFVCGYYDGFHIGHQMSLLKASRLGNRLIVGVHSQDDLINVKNKKPLKSGGERIRAVLNCTYVNQVIPNCPLKITEEFIINNKIHTVGMSDEYALFDKYGQITSVHSDYEVPFKLGILVIIPRTQGVSSSDIRAEVETSQRLDVEELRKIVDLLKTKFASPSS